MSASFGGARVGGAMRPYALSEFEQFVPWRHGCCLYEAPCGCLYDLQQDAWCAACPEVHGDLLYMPDCHALAALSRYLLVEKDPQKREGKVEGGRRVARESALWHWVSEYGIEDEGMAHRFLGAEEYLDLLHLCEEYDRRMGRYALEQAQPAMRRVLELSGGGTVRLVLPQKWANPVSALRSVGIEVAYATGEEARAEVEDVSVRIAALGPRRGRRRDDVRAVLRMAEEVRTGRRQPAKRGTPSSKSGRVRVVGPCRHFFLLLHPRYCTKCGTVVPLPNPPPAL